MRTLDEIALAHGTDKASQHPYTAHDYCRHYEKFFEPGRGLMLKVLEIGVGGGESIKTWLEYFPNAAVFGVDLVENTNPWNTADSGVDLRYAFTKGDQSSEAFWTEFHATHGGAWDIIIDDGGHEKHQIETSFRCMWPHINYGGLYCIEDLAYSQPHDPLKKIIDRLNSEPACEVDFLYCSRELAIIKKK